MSIMWKNKISFNNAREEIKALKPAMIGKYFDSATSCDELTKTVKLLTEQVAQLLPVLTKTVLDNIHVSKINATPLPEGTPFTSG